MGGWDNVHAVPLATPGRGVLNDNDATRRFTQAIVDGVGRGHGLLSDRTRAIQGLNMGVRLPELFEGYMWSKLATRHGLGNSRALFYAAYGLCERQGDWWEVLTHMEEYQRSARQLVGLAGVRTGGDHGLLYMNSRPELRDAALDTLIEYVRGVK